MANFSRSAAKRALGRIIDDAQNGTISDVLNGLKRARPGSRFIPLSDLTPAQRKRSREVDAERLRRQWSDHREEVENIGTVLIILREGEAACAFVPAEDSERRKIPRARAAVREDALLSFDDVTEAVDTLRGDVHDLQVSLGSLVGEEGIPTLMVAVRRLTSLVNAHRNEWRESKGLPPLTP